MKLLFESIRYNDPILQYHLIHILPDDADSSNPNKHTLKALVKAMMVPNFHITTITYTAFSMLVQEKLNISVNINETWYYKICDFKPTLAYLFPDLVDESKYKYWAYGDLDMVWGNVSRFSHLFQGQYPIIQTGWFHASGTATFYKNDAKFRSLFLEDDMFTSLLTNKCYYNLDEIGTANPLCVHDRGRHSMTQIHRRYAAQHGFSIRHGATNQDSLFLELDESIRWAGYARWFQGSLQIIHASEEFPPGRELMYYHRPARHFNAPDYLHEAMYADMIKYGFLLPSLIPLLSHVMCKRLHKGEVLDVMTAMTSYKPYTRECFDNWEK